MFKKYLSSFLLIFIFSILNGQRSSDVDGLLRKAGLSRAKAERLIKSEMSARNDAKPEQKIIQKDNNVDIDQVKQIISEVTSVNDTRQSENKIAVSVWDPPAVEFNKNKNTTYTFNDTTYFWNGKGWLLKDQVFNKSTEEKSLFFGYDAFKSEPSDFQELNFSSLDPEYVIGPGDEVIIMLWGQTELNVPYVVSKEGFIFIDNLGQVFVNGLTLDKLDKKLFKLLKKVYSSLDDSNGPPSSFLDVSLGSTLNRPFRVFVIGEVAKPGAYDMINSATLFSSLFYFGGPTEKGSLRDIRLLRQGKDLGSIDFYDFLLTGKKKNDLRLQRNDVIFFPARGKTVRVDGEVGRPFIFELKEDENLKDIINMAGGLLTTTYLDRMQIDRIKAPGTRAQEGSMKKIDLNLNEQIKNDFQFEVEDGDRLSFSRINKVFENRVEIKGSIQRPGTYALLDSFRISDLIKKSGGLKGDAFKKLAYLTRVTEDYSNSLIDINLKKVLAGSLEHDILLQNNDIVEIYNSANLKWRDAVAIEGHVKSPGKKQYKAGMNVFDLIFQGGGFENEKHLDMTYFDRAEYSTLNEDGYTFSLIPFRLDSVLAGEGIANKLLKMGDKIRIYSKAEIQGKIGKNITVEGFVKRPGTYILYEDMKLKDILFMAGGIDDPEHLSNIHLHRADIIRINENLNEKIILKVDLKKLINGGIDENIILKNNDIIRVYSAEIFKNKDYVTINGIVAKPGVYELKKNMTLSSLILEAGGVSTSSVSFRADVAKLYYSEGNIDRYAEVKTYDFKKNLQNLISDKKNDIILDPYDVITLREDPYFSLQKTVEIKGNVYYPGEYVISNSGELVSDIISRAGGVTQDANPMASTFVRDGDSVKISFAKILRNPRSKTNFKVRAGDIVTIGGFSDFVKVSGEVHNPGNFQFVKGNSFKDYIEFAGGFNENANKYKAYIINPDGSSERFTFFNRSPKVYDGSEIKVVSKTDSLPFNFTEYVTQLTSIWADLTQAYLVVIAASRI
jgi:polysaccharide export outer membrane protein